VRHAAGQRHHVAGGGGHPAHPGGALVGVEGELAVEDVINLAGLVARSPSAGQPRDLPAGVQR
jgi:hypothetical protein